MGPGREYTIPDGREPFWADASVLVPLWIVFSNVIDKRLCDKHSGRQENNHGMHLAGLLFDDDTTHCREP
jgi:hypothetical protein